METRPLKWNRRVTKIHTTLYIAIPLDWARANKIDRYSDITLELMSDGTLKVCPEVVQ